MMLKTICDISITLNAISLIKIICFFAIAIDFMLIGAYVEVHNQMLWYKKQFEKRPSIYRLVPKKSFQQRIINFLLLRKRTKA
jgi:hypothetical protein